MPEEKNQSLRALDALNFCNAGIQTGLGPFMAIYYTAVRHWQPGQIGVLIASQSLAGIAMQSFSGHFVDESHHKKLLTGIAGFAVALGALGIVTLPSYAMQIGVQLLIGLAVTRPLEWQRGFEARRAKRNLHAYRERFFRHRRCRGGNVYGSPGHLR
jgi:MFS family permease